MQTDPLGVIARVGGGTPNQWVSSYVGTGVAASQDISLAANSLHTTGVNTDLAINGHGFFRVKTSQGIQFTRDGRFHRTTNGTLANASGAVLLSQANVPIVLAPGSFTVTAPHTLMQAGQPPQIIGVNNLSPKGLVQYANNIVSGTAQPFTGTIMQGAINGSNSSINTLLPALMSWQSNYQANTQVLQEEKTRLQQATQLGAVP